MTIQWDANRKIAGSLLEAIGRTPLVRLNRIAQGVDAEILLKIEWFSPSGSLKDRIYLEMITAPRSAASSSRE